MKKLTYAFAMIFLLLAGCSHYEDVVEDKDAWVTLNYNISLSKGVQSRAESDIAVNKLLCVIFEGDQAVKRDTVDVMNGTANYSPKLFTNIAYRIVFWAYYEDSEGNSCFDLTDVKAIKSNSFYDKEPFAENIYKDAYTYVDNLQLSGTAQSPSVTLSRPFAQVNVLSSDTDFNNAVSLGNIPTTCSIKIAGFPHVYNALTKTWTGSSEVTTLTSEISVNPVVIDGKSYYYYASEYVFGQGNATTCTVEVKDQDENVIYISDNVPNLPLGANQRTNMYNDNLLTDAVNYTVSMGIGFADTDNKASY